MSIRCSLPCLCDTCGCFEGWQRHSSITACPSPSLRRMELPCRTPGTRLEAPRTAAAEKPGFVGIGNAKRGPRPPFGHSRGSLALLAGALAFKRSRPGRHSLASRAKAKAPSKAESEAPLLGRSGRFWRSLDWRRWHWSSEPQRPKLRAELPPNPCNGSGSLPARLREISEDEERESHTAYPKLPRSCLRRSVSSRSLGWCCSAMPSPTGRHGHHTSP